MTGTPRHRDYPVTTHTRVYYCACGGQLIPGLVSRPVVPPMQQHRCGFCAREYWIAGLSGGTFASRDYPMAIVAEEQNK